MFSTMLVAVAAVVGAIGGASGATVVKDPFQENAGHYYPDCWVERGEMVCAQRPASTSAIRVGCVGDSITAVGHTSSKAHQYPSQLQVCCSPC